MDDGSCRVVHAVPVPDRRCLEAVHVGEELRLLDGRAQPLRGDRRIGALEQATCDGRLGLQVTEPLVGLVRGDQAHRVELVEDLRVLLGEPVEQRLDPQIVAGAGVAAHEQLGLPGSDHRLERHLRVDRELIEPAFEIGESDMVGGPAGP